MNYRCDECGHIFEQGEEKITIQPHGEEMSGCPLCGGSYEELQECEICGAPLDNDERKFCSSCKKDIADKIKYFCGIIKAKLSFKVLTKECRFNVTKRLFELYIRMYFPFSVKNKYENFPFSIV